MQKGLYGGLFGFAGNNLILAGKGYGLSIAHGAEFEGTVKEVATRYAKTWFIVFNGSISGPNIASLRFKGEEAGYLAGLAAARGVMGNKYGIILGPAVPGEVAIQEGFRQGLKAANPAAELLSINLKDWDDESGGREAANRLFDQGAGLILYTINPLNQPVLQVAEARNRQVINLSYDLHAISPGNVLTSMIISVPVSFMVPATLWKNNTLEGEVYMLGLKEKALDIAGDRGKLAASAAQQVEQARAAIISGKLKVLDKPAS